LYKITIEYKPLGSIVKYSLPSMIEYLTSVFVLLLSNVTGIAFISTVYTYEAIDSCLSNVICSGTALNSNRSSIVGCLTIACSIVTINVAVTIFYINLYNGGDL
jgi:hypothetical protein